MRGGRQSVKQSLKRFDWFLCTFHLSMITVCLLFCFSFSELSQTEHRPLGCTESQECIGWG